MIDPFNPTEIGDFHSVAVVAEDDSGEMIRVGFSIVIPNVGGVLPEQNKYEAALRDPRGSRAYWFDELVGKETGLNRVITAEEFAEAWDSAGRIPLPEEIDSPGFYVIDRKCGEVEFDISDYDDEDDLEAQLDEIGILAHKVVDFAKQFGVEDVRVDEQVAKALIAMGEGVARNVETGDFLINDELLYQLADLDPETGELRGERQSNQLAAAVVFARNSGFDCIYQH